MDILDRVEKQEWKPDGFHPHHGGTKKKEMRKALISFFLLDY